MSQSSSNDKPSSTDENEPEQRGQTVQMNPAMLGQAVNMNPGTEALQHLDAASHLLENAHDDEVGTDLTIERYMAELIARSRGPGQEAEPFAVIPVTEPAVSTTESAAPAEDLPVEPRREVAPPECRDAISELRELANISARSSFSVHKGRQLVYDMHNKLAVTMVALMVSFGLTSLATHTRSPAYFAAVISLIVALAWTVKYFRLGRHLNRLCLVKDEVFD